MTALCQIHSNSSCKTLYSNMTLTELQNVQLVPKESGLHCSSTSYYHASVWHRNTSCLVVSVEAFMQLVKLFSCKWWAALLKIQCFNGQIYTSVPSCWGRGAANAGCCCFMVCCQVRGIVKRRGISTRGCITRCSDQKVAVLCHLIRTSKNVEGLNFWFVRHGIIYYWNRAAVRHMGLLYNNASLRHSSVQQVC
jgi:hypothetical protein